MDPTPTTGPYREGERAFREGGSRNDHGYPLDSWEAVDFAAGYEQAEKDRAIDVLLGKMRREADR